MKTVDQLTAALDTMSAHSLGLLCERSRPIPILDVARLEADGLAEFVRETRSGTTWFRATPLGRRVFAAHSRATDATQLGTILEQPPKRPGKAE